MQSSLKTPQHQQREIANFRGLFSAAEDSRLLPEGFLGYAYNVMFDEQGNIRPRDGSAQWWAPISQRVYLAEMEPGENSTWANGAASTTAQRGYQSRLINGTVNMDRVLPASIDLLQAANYAATVAYLQIAIRAATPADNTSVILYISSGAGFAANTRSFDITASVAAAVATTWTEISALLSGGTDIGGAPNLAAITRIRISVTQTAGSDIYFDEMFVRYTTFDKSFGLGGIEYRRISDSKRYVVAGFGETVFADLNEAKTPYKILSNLTRNAPLYYETFEDRLGIFNGVDNNYVFDGDGVRTLGFPAPTSWTPGFTYAAAGGSLTPGDDYYYGIVFVYGNGATRYGQSTIFVSPTAATVGGGTDTINLANIPVGAVGSGVVARRIYRCRANAGASATKYYVAELSDNTTTTYADGLADSLLILNAEAPYNNGVPPIAKSCTWYQKAAVYFTKTAVYWSRPGVNLDETPETVPSENVINLGHMGDLMGGVEFNNNLYIWGRRGIGKLQWRGPALEFLPVQRVGESTAQGVGCDDRRAITVVKDRYLRWADPEGRVWRMLPNEEILPESRFVQNLVTDKNVLPKASSLDYYNVDSEAQWNTGTLAASSNLSTAEVSGQLRYGVGTNLGGSGNSFSLAATPITLASSTMASGATVGASFDTGASGSSIFLELSSPGKGMMLNALRLFLKVSAPGGGLHYTVEVTPRIPKYEDPADKLNAPTVVGTLSYNGEAAAGISDVVMDVAFPDIYLPPNEYLLLQVKILYTLNTGVVFLMAPAGSPYFADNSGLLQLTATSGAGIVVPGQVRAGIIGISYQEGVVATGAVLDYGAALQRYLFFNDAPDLGVPYLRSAKELEVVLQYSSDNVNWTPWVDTVFKKTALLPTTNGEPLSIIFRPLAQPPDYRPAEPYPSGTQYRYIRPYVRFTLTGQPPPATSAFSYISTSYATTFPQVLNPEMKASRQASFGASYAKEDYLRDIWTSEIVSTAGISAFGRIYLEYFQGQQDVFLQVRTATSSGGISGATWYDVAPNDVIGTTGVVASATHFQVRIIFQDNPGRSNGNASYISKMTVSWNVAGADLAPLCPTVLYHYQDYTFMSWASAGSRTLDRSAAIDDFSDGYSQDQHRWSSFGAPHYTSYFTAAGKLLGGTATGGRLNLLRQSATTDAGGAVFVCAIQSLPMNLGTMYLKTLHHWYFGLVLNIHKNGQFLGELAQYPAADSTHEMLWAVAGNRIPAVNFYFPPPPGTLLLFGQQVGRQEPSDLLPHTPVQTVLLTFPNTKPYQAEYGVDMGLTERAFVFTLSWRPFLDSASNGVFPTVTNFGMEYFIENLRGL